MKRNPNASYHLADTHNGAEHYYTGRATWTLDRSERGVFNYRGALEAALLTVAPSHRKPRIVAEV